MFNNSESRFWRSQVLIILGILAGLNIFAWIAVWELARSGGLAAFKEGEPRPDESGREVTFFDVGQGDAALIQGTVTKTSDGRW